MTAERKFSDELDDWLRGDTPKTLGDMSDAFYEKSFAVTILLLMFVPALPLPTGGITHVFEVITVFVALQMVIGRRTIWLPRRWRQRALGVTITGKAVPFIIRRVRWFEKFTRPRMAWLFRQRWFIRVLGLVIVAFTAGAAIAPPFSGLDTLPALGVVLLSLGVLLEDVLVVVVALVVGVAGVVLEVVLGSAAIHGLGKLTPGQLVEVRAQSDDGHVITFTARARVDNETELGYLHNGGILPLVLRQLIASS